MTKTTICLNMIVKDEAHVIRQTLELMVPYIHYWVICDTGSTDNTCELIENFFKEKKIPGELFHDKWRDFGYNRSLALKRAYNKTDYVWVFDADDLIVGKLVFPQPMGADCYSLKFGKGFVYDRNQLFNNRLKWRYRGVLHEYPECVNKRSVTYMRIEGDYFIDSRRLGARNKDPLKYQKDAAILVKAIETDPELKDRYMFYAAQSYKDFGDYENSNKYYQMRADQGGWAEEVYYSYEMIGVNSMNLGKSRNYAKIIHAFLKGQKSLPRRIECLVHLGTLYKEMGEFEKAHKIFRLASTIPFPNDLALFLKEHYYQYETHAFLAQTSELLGYTEEAKEAWKRVLAVPSIEHVYNFKHYPSARAALSEYPSETIELLRTRPKPQKVKLTMTITSCKRLHLFQETMNSFLNHVTDYDRVDRFICIDDNSSPEDRETMQRLYPFFEFYFKDPDDKGHIQSLEWIRKNVTSPFHLQLEDDWLFVKKGPWITNALRVLEGYSSDIVIDKQAPIGKVWHTKKIGQVLFNRNYQEDCEHRIEGGYKARLGKLSLLIHQYIPSNTPEYNKEVSRLKSSCIYWPHYSLRPGITRTEVYQTIGAYTAKNGFFEMEYASRYWDQHYVTCFLEQFTCIHIGRCTYERHDDTKDNAYSLNQTVQFNEALLPNPFTSIDEFTFYEGKDSHGEDIHYMDPSQHSLKDMVDYAKTHPEVMGFNTYGYFKSYIHDKAEFMNLPVKKYQQEGLWVRCTSDSDEFKLVGVYDVQRTPLMNFHALVPIYQIAQHLHIPLQIINTTSQPDIILESQDFSCLDEAGAYVATFQNHGTLIISSPSSWDNLMTTEMYQSLHPTFVSLYSSYTWPLVDELPQTPMSHIVTLTELSEQHVESISDNVIKTVPVHFYAIDSPYMNHVLDDQIHYVSSFTEIPEYEHDWTCVLTEPFVLTEGKETWKSLWSSFLHIAQTNQDWNRIYLGLGSSHRKTSQTSRSEVDIEPCSKEASSPFYISRQQGTSCFQSTIPLFISLSKQARYSVMEYLHLPQLEMKGHDIYKNRETPKEWIYHDSYNDEGVYRKWERGTKKYLVQHGKGDYIARSCFNVLDVGLQEWGLRTWTSITMNVPQVPDGQLPLYCINLKRRQDRKEALIELSKKHGLVDPIQFVEAVEGGTLTPNREIYHLFSGCDKNFKFRRSMIGCAFSHIKLMEALVHDPHHDYYIIMEDDVYFSSEPPFSGNLQHDFRNVLASLQKIPEWDVLLLGYHKWEPKESKDSTLVITHVDDVRNYVGGLFGYIVRKKAAMYYLAMIRQCGLQNAIDTFTMKHREFLTVLEMSHELVLSDWVRPLPPYTVDTDIQLDFSVFEFHDPTDFLFISGYDIQGHDIPVRHFMAYDALGYCHFHEDAFGFTNTGVIKKKPANVWKHIVSSPNTVLAIQKSKWITTVYDETTSFIVLTGITIQDTQAIQIQSPHFQQEDFKHLVFQEHELMGFDSTGSVKYITETPTFISLDQGILYLMKDRVPPSVLEIIKHRFHESQ